MFDYQPGITHRDPCGNWREANRQATSPESAERIAMAFYDIGPVLPGCLKIALNAVGPNRLRLLESGKIDFGDLVTRSGKLRTLKELEEI